MNRVLILARKEFTEILRDFRTLFILLFLPVLLYPVLVVGVAFYTSRSEAEQARSTVKVGVYECPPELFHFLMSREGIQVVELFSPPGELRARIDLEGEVSQAILDCSGLNESPPRPVEALYLSTRSDSLLARDRLVDALTAFREAWLLQSLQLLGYSADYGRALIPEYRDLSPPARISGFILAQVLPLVLVLVILQGAYHPSMDLVVGERERKTVEALLTAPVTPWDILAAKTLVISTVAWLSGILNLVSLTLNLGLASRFVEMGTSMRVGLFPGYGPLALVLLEMVPLSILFASLFVSSSAFSRTFRESQSHLVPVIFLVIAPATVMFLAIPNPSPVLYGVPVFSSLYLIKATLIGKVNLWVVAISTVIALMASALLLRWGAYLWTSERVLYGAGETAAHPRKRTGVVTATEALGLFLVAAFGVFQTQLWIGSFSIPLAVVASHLAVMGGGVLILILVKRAPLAKTLHLFPLNVTSFIAAVLFGIGAIGLSQAFSAGLSQFLPVPSDFNEKLIEVMQGLGPVVSFWTLVLLPAIFEELLFRGLLFKAFARDWGVVFGLIFSSILFGLMHLEAALRIIQTAFLGLMIAYAMIRCGSLLAAIIVHFFVNSFAVGLVFLVPEVAHQAESEYVLRVLLAFTGIGVIAWLGAERILAIARIRKTTNENL